MLQEYWFRSFAGVVGSLWQGTRQCVAARNGGAKRSPRRSERWRAESLESRTLLAALVSLNSSSPSLAENGGTAVVTATLNEPQDHDVFVNLNLGGTAGNNVGYRATTSAA
ncbi:MAG: hypothetical protein U0929_03235, partial [Planctomycetaceae bacterium]